MRQVRSRVNDSERVFAYRAFWLARGFDSALTRLDEKTCANTARADEFSWSSHVDEFRSVRLATLAFFQHLQPEIWMRSGVASGNSFTIRALAYTLAGHVAHHVAILRERYL